MRYHIIALLTLLAFALPVWAQVSITNGIAIGGDQQAVTMVSVVKTAAVATLDKDTIEHYFKWPSYTYSAGGNSVWTDSSGNGLNATQTTDAHAPPTATQAYVYFQKTSHKCVVAPTNAAFYTSQSYTWICRANVQAYTSENGGIFGATTGNRRLTYTTTTSPLRPVPYVQGTAAPICSADFWDAGVWHVYAMTFKKSGTTTSITFYRDGAQIGDVSTVSAGEYLSGVNVAIMGYDGNAYTTEGLCKYFVTYSSAKTAAQIQAMTTYLQGLP